jgi:hypothetical protein
MTKIHQHQHESFLSLIHEGQEVGNRVCQILADIDAQKSVQRLSEHFQGIAYNNADNDITALRKAVFFVDYAEEAVIELTAVTQRRNMDNTEEHLGLARLSRQLGLRLYRNLWELSLSDSDRKNLRLLMQRTATLHVWEDIPSPLLNRSYERVTNGMDGMIVYDHCYGLTYMQYNQGSPVLGWSVLRDYLEESLVMARTSLSLVVDRLLVTAVKL